MGRGVGLPHRIWGRCDSVHSYDKVPFFLVMYTFANDHTDESRGQNAGVLLVNRCVLGLAETTTNTIPVTLDPHEMPYKYNVFKVGRVGSHQVPALGRNQFNHNAVF